MDRGRQYGANTYGQVGRGNTTTPATTPVQVTGTTWRSVAGGEYHTCATKTDNTLWCWGDNDDGELGQGGTAGPATSPVQVPGTTWLLVGHSQGAQTMAIR